MNTHKDAKSVMKDQMAEKVGFEPTVSITPRPISNLTQEPKTIGIYRTKNKRKR